MLFNSYEFLLGFLPLVLLGHAALARLGRPQVTIGWLILCSVVFYGFWNPTNLLIIAPSMVVNYLLGLAMHRQMQRGAPAERLANVLLVVGITFNVLFLGYFKYRNFFLDSVNHLTGTSFALAELVLPLGISFITFQKIAFLVDVRTGHIKNISLQDFLIFVFFFPQLIAGPIVHFREMVPQFHEPAYRMTLRNTCVAAALFGMGLFKKTVLADNIAPYSSSVFAAARAGESIGFIDAWFACFAFLLQVYFDFSGYSDMATGLARLFGIRLPLNFDSPIKASSIIDFWNRWHMTLTRFLTAYIYGPLSFSLTRRRAAAGKSMITRKKATIPAFAVLVATPTIVTLFISGVWHGAGLTFIVFGLLHGSYLVINHAWRQWRPKWPKERYDAWMTPIGLVLTVLCASLAMAFFKAGSMAEALGVVRGMLGFNGITMPPAILDRLGALGVLLQQLGVGLNATSGADFMWRIVGVAGLFAVALGLPNSMEILSRYEPALGLRSQVASRLQATLSPAWGVVFGVAMVMGILSLNRVSEFLYWQF